MAGSLLPKEEEAGYGNNLSRISLPEPAAISISAWWGQVRTGKSHADQAKRIMEELVIPAMEDPFRAERARDELPQCGSGRTPL